MISVNSKKLFSMNAEKAVAAIQKHLDATAKKFGYDDIKSAVTYADEPSVAKFQLEGQAFRAWRSLCWAKCYEIQSQVEDGKMQPPSIEQLIDELPKFNLQT